MRKRTSETDPLRVDLVDNAELGVPGSLGMTIAPGMKDDARGGRWERDLDADLRRLKESYGTDVLVSLMEQEEYEKAAEETRRILIDVARRGGTISYTDLCRKIESVSVEPDSHALAHILGLVSAAEDREGNGMLSVLVVYKGGQDLRPGPGFFNLARQLDYDLPDREAEDACSG